MLEDSIPTLALLPMLLTLEYFGLTYNHGLEQIKSENNIVLMTSLYVTYPASGC